MIIEGSKQNESEYIFSNLLIFYFLFTNTFFLISLSFFFTDVLDVYSSHGCPLQCPRVEGFSGGKYGSTCNGPAGQCISGEIPKGEPTSERNVGEPTCVCDGNEGWVGPACDKKCPRDATGKSSCQNGHCAYDAALDAGRCFCDQYHIGTNCEKSTDGLPAAPAAASTRTSGVEVFGWVLFVFALFGLIGFVVYHKRSMGEWGGSGNGSLTFDVWIDWIETYVLVCVVLRFYICQRSSAGIVQHYNSCRVSLCSCRVTNWFSIFIKLCHAHLK